MYWPRLMLTPEALPNAHAPWRYPIPWSGVDRALGPVSFGRVTPIALREIALRHVMAQVVDRSLEP